MKKYLLTVSILLLLSSCSNFSQNVEENRASSSGEMVEFASSADSISLGDNSESSEINSHGNYVPNLLRKEEYSENNITFSNEEKIDSEIYKYFELLSNTLAGENSNIEMPYSFQWIHSYIQFDDDLYDYMRASSRYSEWEEYYNLKYLKGREYQQNLYDVIRFFDISREEFEALYADNIIPDAEWEERRSSGNAAVFSLSESMVDALFDGDTYTRNSLFCAKESAFVAAADGEVYSGFWMLYNTPAEALESASFTLEELTRFVETLRVPYAERAESDISADYANYAMAEPLQEFVEEWYAEYMALAGETP